MPRKPPIHRPAGALSADQRRGFYDRQRDTQAWRGWYKTARWQRKREAQLAAEPLCANCLKHGRITAATVADHPTPHRGDYDLFWNQPLQSLCDEAPWRCHSSVKQREEQQTTRPGDAKDDDVASRGRLPSWEGLTWNGTSYVTCWG